LAPRFDPLLVLEAAYDAAPSEVDWLGGIAEACVPLGRGLGVVAVSLGLEGWRASGIQLVGVGGDPTPFRAAASVWESAPPSVVRGWFEPVPPVDTLLGRARRAGVPLEQTPIPTWRALGIGDALGVMGLDPLGNAVLVQVPSARELRVSPRNAHRLGLVAAHLAAARRLRRLARPDADAVLDPSGRVHHAAGEARAPAARASLAAAVQRTERARGRLRREEPDEALSLWRGLVDGRWSLVDQVEADGRRLVLARRNPPGVHDPRALTARERDVLAHVAQGHGNKHVAYTLGLSATTVATHLHRALVKLGLRTRRDAIALFEAAARAGRPSPP